MSLATPRFRLGRGVLTGHPQRVNGRLTLGDMSTDTSTCAYRRPRVRRPARLAQVAVATLLLVACSPAEESPSSAAPPSGASTTPEESAPSTAGATPVRVIIGETVLTGRLFNNATANDLASQLPLTLTFRDLNGVEKISPLPRKLSVDTMPRGDDPEIGDIGYWAPDGNLVLYYGDVGYWTGIMRVGEFNGDMQAVAQQSDGFTATVELAR